MKLFNKVAIIGVGLIGGSIALAMKKSRHKETLSLARKTGAIDIGARDFSVIKDADLVILATPVDIIIELGRRISSLVNKECIVTDVGSTKKEVVSALEKVFPGYVGSHPLAGSEKRGLINANAAIFRDSLCILTPTQNTQTHAEAKIKKLWVKLGARVVYLTPSRHDKILSLVSHLPHLVAFSLISAVPVEFLKFASTGFRDTTRIAASDGEIWRDILFSNDKNIVEAIDLFQANLAGIKSAIRRKDRKGLFAILKMAKRKKETLL